MNFLAEWVRLYVRHRDIFAKSIVGITETGDEILVKYRDRERRYIIMPQIPGKPGVFDSDVVLVTLNTRENVKEVIKGWDNLIKSKSLSIIFVNPADSHKWILHPYTHDKISERQALAPGLWSLFENAA
ncbi:MAG: hypothetical protein ABH879_02590 [archaeon]